MQKSTLLSKYDFALIAKKEGQQLALLFFISLLPNMASGASKKPWLEAGWLKLMRYNKTLTGYESEVDNKEYFVSSKGKTNPKKEFIKTLSELRKPLKDETHLVCHFPGRYLYFKKREALPDYDLSLCKEYSQFKEKLQLESVSVIFSSYYINKPASAFGHTLLKLNSKVKKGSVDLHSYGVDYSAQVTTTNPLIYGVYGMIGGFYGKFSLLPYFLKLREYNDFESRDLWEFELDLSENEKEFFVAHLWDMNRAAFQYYYFTENCSYHVLRFIDAIKPKLNLMDNIGKVIIPIDTIRPLVDKKLVKNYYYRPSLQKRVAESVERLDLKEKDYVEKSLSDLKLSDRKWKEESSQAKALDVLMDVVDYKYSKEIYLKEEKTRISDFKREILLKRSTLEETSKKSTKEKRKSFDYAHPTSYFKIGSLDGRNEGMAFSYRTALHDILQPSGDVYSDFTLVMNELELHWNEGKRRLYFDNYNFAHVFTLRPLNFYEKKISWDFSFGLKSKEEEEEDVAPFVHVGVGPSVKFLGGTFYLFANTRFENLMSEQKLIKNEIGPRAGYLFKSGRFGILADYTKYFEFSKFKEISDFYTLEGLYSFSSSLELSTTGKWTKEGEIDSLSWGLRYLF